MLLQVQEHDRRRLVGRRYEDYLRNDIVIELSPEEKTWRMIFQDPRYQSMLDRRRKVRRIHDRLPLPAESSFTPHTSFFLLEEEMES
ncbi:MAG: hypothetical protein GXO78_04235 [Calditrichaeota bacterium]|nr:hypothetical protein [Calditrichota bacterium]